MKQPCVTLAAIALSLALLTPVPAVAALLIDEPFDYVSNSNLPEFGSKPHSNATQPASLGGTGLSLQPRPVPARAPLGIGFSGLSYTDSKGRALGTSGFAAIIPEGESAVFNFYDTGAADPFARLRNTQDPRELGRSGEIAWLSFLMRAEGEPEPGHKFSIRFTGGKTSLPIGLLNRPSSGLPTISVISTSSGVRVESRKTYLVVVRLVLGESGGLELWVNPDIGGDRPAADPNITLKTAPVFLRSLWFTKSTGGRLAVTFDELRLGETYADVAPSL